MRPYGNMDILVAVEFPRRLDHRFIRPLFPVERGELYRHIHVRQSGDDIGVARSPHGICRIHPQQHDRRGGEPQVENVSGLAGRLRHHVVAARARRVAHRGGNPRPCILDGGNLPFVGVHEKGVHLRGRQRNRLRHALAFLPRHRQTVIAAQNGFTARNGQRTDRRRHQHHQSQPTSFHRLTPPRYAPRPALPAARREAVQPFFPERDAPSPALSRQAEQARNPAPASADAAA